MQCGYRNLYCTFPKLVVWRIDIDYKYKPHSTLNNKNIRFNSLLRSVDIDKVVKKKIYNPKRKILVLLSVLDFVDWFIFQRGSVDRILDVKDVSLDVGRKELFYHGRIHHEL